MEYSHTQRGRLHVLGYALGVAFVWTAAVQRTDPWAFVILLLCALLVLSMTRTFAEMTVRDEGTRLAVRYGPTPLFRKLVPYDRIESVELGESRFIDGLGIHFVPWRGWTYNLWGFPCVILHLRNSKYPLRIGTDDGETLLRFLESRLAARDGAQHTTSGTTSTAGAA